MFTLINPRDVLPPPGPLSWGIDLRQARRIVIVSGQVGADPDGRIGDGLLEQARLTWENVGKVLREADMGPANIVRTGIYLTRDVQMTDDLKASFNALRVGFLGSHRPASTMIVVHALMDPRWLVEIDAIAAA